MEEIEIPLEKVQETIQEKAGEGSGEGGGWNMRVAVTTAFMAVLAAIAGLLAGHHSNEALIDQVKASDQWSYYQAKSIKTEVRKLLPAAERGTKTPEEVKKEEEAIQEKAREEEKSSEEHLQHHKTLAASVTLFQVAIALSAIAILTRKTLLWYGAVLIAIGGTVFFVMGLI
jgi:Domain of unknown function (DUF4337)